MESEHLIDFNSPLKGKLNMLDPLVPLPRSKIVVPYGSEVPSDGDNPFDSVILQLCTKDDPFEMVESRALMSGDQNDSRSSKAVKEEIVSAKFGDDNVKSTIEPSKHDVPTGSTSIVDGGKADLLDKKFSTLYMSAQLEKQILDESSEFMDRESVDVSFSDTSLSKRSIEKSRTTNIESPVRLPSSKCDMKAFVAGRIEKCIEKALNESRRSMNQSPLRHRRSVSATALYPSLRQSPFSDRHRPPSRPCSPESSRMRPSLSASTHNLQNFRSPWKALSPTRNYSLGVSDKFIPGFRRSTSSINILSSKYSCEPALKGNSATFGTHRRSLSHRPSLTSGISKTVGDDAVFLDGKSSSCVFLEAKNISGLFRRKAISHDNPGAADSSDEEDFLTRDDWKVKLVDSDTDTSNDRDSLREVTDKVENNKQQEVEAADKREDTSTTVVMPAPLSWDNVKDLALSICVKKTKKSPPMPMALPPMPVNASGEGAVLKLKTQTQANSRIAPRGPMKAMIPLGNMIRKKDSPVSGKSAKNSPASSQGVNLKNRTSLAPQPRRPSAVQSESSRTSGYRGSVTRKDKKNSPPGQPAEKNALNNKSNAVKKNSPVAESTPCKIRPSEAEFHDSKIISPIPVACSTPAIGNVPSLISPPLSLQLSTGELLNPSPLPGYGRSKSAGHIGPSTPKTESISTTPVRKLTRVRSVVLPVA